MYADDSKTVYESGIYLRLTSDLEFLDLKVGDVIKGEIYYTSGFPHSVKINGYLNYICNPDYFEKWKPKLEDVVLLSDRKCTVYTMHYNDIIEVLMYDVNGILNRVNVENLGAHEFTPVLTTTKWTPTVGKSVWFDIGDKRTKAQILAFHQETNTITAKLDNVVIEDHIAWFSPMSKEEERLDMPVTGKTVVSEGQKYYVGQLSENGLIKAVHDNDSKYFYYINDNWYVEKDVKLLIPSVPVTGDVIGYINGIPQTTASEDKITTTNCNKPKKDPLTTLDDLKTLSGREHVMDMLPKEKELYEKNEDQKLYDFVSKGSRLVHLKMMAELENKMIKGEILSQEEKLQLAALTGRRDPSDPQGVW